MKPVALTPWECGDFLKNVDGKLHCDGVDVTKLVEQHGSPLFVYSEKKLLDNARSILEAFRGVHSKTSVCYASKACSNLAILKLFKAEGLDIEVNSGGELYKAKAAGYQGHQIVFNGVSKLREELKEAINYQIKAINVDSISELERIIAVARECGKKANVALRVIPHIKGGGVSGWETGSPTSKFGMMREEIFQAISMATEAADAVAVKGIHAHIGSQVTNIEVYAKEAEFFINFLSDIRDLLPAPLEHLNLGGGYPKPYIQDNRALDVDSMHYQDIYCADATFSDIASLLISPLRDKLGEDIELVIEPGRSMVADAGIMLSSVEAVKQKNGTPWLYLDAGYNVVFDFFISWYLHSVNASRSAADTVDHFRVAGPLCDSHDVLFDVEGETAVEQLIAELPEFESRREQISRLLIHQPSLRELPKETGIGDIIAFMGTGAYTLETMSHYCGRLKPGAVMVKESGAVDLIRRRDNFSDLLQNEVLD